MTINRYPKIKQFALDVALCNDMINRLEPEGAFLERCEQALFADGVLTEDLERLEAWLDTLTEEQFETLADGDADDIDRLMYDSPVTLDGDPVICVLDDVFGF